MIEIRCIRDITEAERLWRLFETHDTINNDWEYRYCFYKYQPMPLAFYVAYEITSDDHEEPVGLMPLQYNSEWNGLEFFAEDPCWENRIFVKPGYNHIIPKFYENLPGKSKFWCLSGEDEYTMKLPIYDYVYGFPLTAMNSFNDFLHLRLNAKRRRALIKEIDNLEQNDQVEILVKKEVSADWINELNVLFKYNSENIAESFLKTEEERAPRRDFLKLPYSWRLIIIKISGKTQGVTLSVMYGRKWQFLLTGANYKEFSGLGKLLIKKTIEEAMKEKAEYFDAGLADCKWKKLWHFDGTPQYEFIKDPEQAESQAEIGKNE